MVWREHRTLTDTDRRRRADDRIENVNIKWGGGQPEEREVGGMGWALHAHTQEWGLHSHGLWSGSTHGGHVGNTHTQVPVGGKGREEAPAGPVGGEWVGATHAQWGGGVGTALTDTKWWGALCSALAPSRHHTRCRRRPPPRGRRRRCGGGAGGGGSGVALCSAAAPRSAEMR